MLQESDRLQRYRRAGDWSGSEAEWPAHDANRIAMVQIDTPTHAWYSPANQFKPHFALIQRGGGTGPTKPRQPTCGVVPIPADGVSGR